MQATAGSEQEETITVPSRHVGAVIGKGGEMINSMIQRSGCQIILQKVTASFRSVNCLVSAMCGPRRLIHIQITKPCTYFVYSLVAPIALRNYLFSHQDHDEVRGSGKREVYLSGKLFISERKYSRGYSTKAPSCQEILMAIHIRRVCHHTSYG